MSRFRPGLPITIATALALIVLLSLGTWQMRRLAWKEALLADIQTSLAGPAQAIEVANWVEFAKVELKPHGVSPNYVRFGSGAVDGRLTTDILRVVGDRNGRQWLVNFGSLFADIQPDAPDLAAPGMQLLVGIMRPPGRAGWFTPANDIGRRQFYSYDMRALEALFGVRLAPWIIDIERLSKPPGIANNHFVYALTWYGIAVGLVAVYIAFGLKQPESGTS